jgi:hypothetical protein
MRLFCVLLLAISASAAAQDPVVAPTAEAAPVAAPPFVPVPAAPAGFDIPNTLGASLIAVVGGVASGVGFVASLNRFQLVGFLVSPVIAALVVFVPTVFIFSTPPAVIMGGGALVGAAVGSIVALLTLGAAIRADDANDSTFLSALAFLVAVPVGTIAGTLGGWVVTRQFFDDSTPE